MDATKGNGLDAANDQPAKTLTKYVTDFIACITRFADADAGLTVVIAVVALQAALLVLMGVLQ